MEIQVSPRDVLLLALKGIRERAETTGWTADAARAVAELSAELRQLPPERPVEIRRGPGRPKKK